MTGKPLRILPRAQEDVAAALDRYRFEAGSEVATRFADAVMERLNMLAQRPQLGSRSHAPILDIDGLRSIRLRRFPYLLFYVEHDDSVDVVRLLHNRRDIAAALRDE